MTYPWLQASGEAGCRHPHSFPFLDIDVNKHPQHPKMRATPIDSDDFLFLHSAAPAAYCLGCQGRSERLFSGSVSQHGCPGEMLARTHAYCLMSTVENRPPSPHQQAVQPQDMALRTLSPSSLSPYVDKLGVIVPRRLDRYFDLVAWLVYHFHVSPSKTSSLPTFMNFAD